MTRVKDPDAVLDYGFDWTAWLEAGETIATSTWTADEGITVGDSAIGTGTTKVWLSGGTDGTEYLVTNEITTSAGRTDDRSIRVIVRER